VAKVFDQTAIAGRNPFENLTWALVERAASGGVGYSVPAQDQDGHDNRTKSGNRALQAPTTKTWMFHPRCPRETQKLSNLIVSASRLASND
jgi:hypothetical protein